MARQDPGEPFFRIDSDEAAVMLTAEPDNTAMIDVRRDDEWVSGHVTGAMHIPIDDLMGRIDELPQGKKLLFICAAGVRSGLACEMAAALGMPADSLYNVEDGTPIWIERNHPTSYGNEP